MRPSVPLCQCSRYRLLTLLLVSLLGILCVQTVGGSPTAIFGPNLNTSELIGGEPLSRNYRLTSRCKSHVQITPARGRQAIHARDSADSDFEELTFESHSPNVLRIQGVKTQKYLCFSRRGRLIARYQDKNDLCLIREIPTDDDYIMLQSVAVPTWYVGFNRRGVSMAGYIFTGTESGITPTHHSRDQELERGQQGSRAAGKQRRHQRRHHHGASPSHRRHRGQLVGSRVRQRWDRRRECFQFIKTPTQEDTSDPRVQNRWTKNKYDPLKGSDLSRLMSTPDPR